MEEELEFFLSYHPVLKPEMKQMLFEQLNMIFTDTSENSLFKIQQEESPLDLLGRFAKSFKLCIDFIPKSVKSTKSVAMKQGKRFIDFFITEHLKIVSKHLKESKEETVGVLRVLQYGTRLLQSTCNDTKAEKDAGMMAIVPGLKRSLERLVFEMKTVLSNNGALGAFFVGKKHICEDWSFKTKPFSLLR